LYLHRLLVEFQYYLDKYAVVSYSGGQETLFGKF